MNIKLNPYQEYMRRFVRTYEQKVSCLIREKYTQDEEFALLRQRDSKPEEFAEYNTYCEECKTKVKDGTFDKEVQEYINKQRESFKNMFNRDK
jgi:hypothetical protein